MNSDIAMQKMLTHATKRAQEIPQSRPQPFGGIGMDFTPTIGILIASQFFHPKTDGLARTLEGIVTVIFVGMHQVVGLRELLHKPTQRQTFRMSAPPASESRRSRAPSCPTSADGHCQTCLVRVVCWLGNAGGHQGQNFSTPFSPAFWNISSASKTLSCHAFSHYKSAVFCWIRWRNSAIFVRLIASSRAKVAALSPFSPPRTSKTT